MNTPQDMHRGCVHQSNKWGAMRVLQYVNKLNVTVEFENTGAQVTARSTCIRSGEVKDPLARSVYGVGYIGIGPHTSMDHGKESRAYVHWRAMMQRCYSDQGATNNAAYAGCTVDPRWHNFQNFARWYEETYPHRARLPRQLDKDSAQPGNRVYAPELCRWLTARDNAREANRRRRAAARKSLITK